MQFCKIFIKLRIYKRKYNIKIKLQDYKISRLKKIKFSKKLKIKNYKNKFFPNIIIYNIADYQN